MSEQKDWGGWFDKELQRYANSMQIKAEKTLARQLARIDKVQLTSPPKQIVPVIAQMTTHYSLAKEHVSEDRPSLAVRLDRAEEQRDQLLKDIVRKDEEISKLKRDLTMFRMDIQNFEETLKRAWERNQALDTMGSDLNKLRRAIGTIRFEEIVNGD
jgi:septal ring factor EnvC (AmiA/AmiB activator)